jgi:predicted aspartyl protease
MPFAKRLVVLAAAATLGAAAPSDPLALLATANGHPARVHVRGTSTRTIEGRRVVETLDVQGSNRLLRRCIAEVCEGTWFDGVRRWKFGMNEVPLPEDEGSPPLRRTLAAIASLAFAEPSFRAEGGTVTPAGADGWLVRARDGTPLVARFDPQSRTLRHVTTEAGVPVAQYRHEVRVGGAAFALDRREPDGVVLDGAVAVAEPLRTPEGPAISFSGDAGAPLGGDAVPIVPCSLGGRPIRCLIDSGATPSAITLPLAESLGLEPRGELEITGFSRFVTGYVDAGPLNLGSARITRARFAVIPAVSTARFDVVVGADLLGRLRVVLDRARGRAEILAPGTTLPEPALRLHFGSGVPHVEISLDGEPGSALFDSGDASVVSMGYVDYRRGTQWPLVERGQTAGVAGASDAFVVAVPRVQIGPIGLGTVRATVSRTQQGVHVGAGLGATCVLVLDEPSEALGCTRR